MVQFDWLVKKKKWLKDITIYIIIDISVCGEKKGILYFFFFHKCYKITSLILY